MNLQYVFHVFLSSLVSVLRLGAGAAPQTEPDDTALPPSRILYEFEACPFCRFAREAISESGQPVLVRPCPKGGTRFRPQVTALGGKAQFPFLHDETNGQMLYESAALAKQFARESNSQRPIIHWLGPINLYTSQVGVLFRLFAGRGVRRSSPPAAPLQFHGAERDPRARLVKERLCEMELEYIWTPRAAPSGAVLIDPNNGERIEGAFAIRNYLNDVYAP